MQQKRAELFFAGFFEFFEREKAKKRTGEQKKKNHGGRNSVFWAVWQRFVTRQLEGGEAQRVQEDTHTHGGVFSSSTTWSMKRHKCCSFSFRSTPTYTFKRSAASKKPNVYQKKCK